MRDFELDQRRYEKCPGAPSGPASVMSCMHCTQEGSVNSDTRSARGGLDQAPTPPPPPAAYRDPCQLSPRALHDWLQEQASILAQVGYDACWGANYTPGGGLPLDWFERDQQLHILAHCMDNILTIIVLAHRSSHRDTALDTSCFLCGTNQETAPHLWVCSARSHEWRMARERLAALLDRYMGHRLRLCAPSCGNR